MFYGPPPPLDEPNFRQLTEAQRALASEPSHVSFAKVCIREWVREYPWFAEDFEFSSWLSLCDAARRFDGRGSFLTFLKPCIQNRLCSTLRDLRARKRIPLGLLHTLTPGLDPVAPEPDAAPDYPPGLVGKLLGALPDQSRRMTEAHLIQGETYRTIGDREGVTRERVQQVVIRAVKGLREHPAAVALMKP